VKTGHASGGLQVHQGCLRASVVIIIGGVVVQLAAPFAPVTSLAVGLVSLMEYAERFGMTYLF